MGDETLTIAGILRYNPFTANGSSDGRITLITSDETFVRLTGITDYSLVLLQTTGDVTNEDVEAIRLAAGKAFVLRDNRESRTSNTYLAFVICLYGFLVIIALITVLNIINNISMSVNARIGQYGAMRAVGMDERQIVKMIAAEALTYAVSGCVVGCVAGLLVHKLLYDVLITSHYSYAVWRVPVLPLAVILLFVLTAACAAVYAPARRMCRMSVTETINEL